MCLQLDRGALQATGKFISWENVASSQVNKGAAALIVGVSLDSAVIKDKEHGA